MSHKTRVRFAPSPTGPLHIGGVRTALYNYLFAKKNNGTFILRIEDTDQKRYVPKAEQYIIDSLNWAGIPFDEGPGKNEIVGPYRQSERKKLYQQYAQELIDKDLAYYAFDTNEELDAYRKNYQEEGKTFIYNWHNREELNNSLHLDPETLNKKIKQGDQYVIRFKTPLQKELVLYDLIRGEIRIDTHILDDKVLFKSDGMPTYHLANIVDDHLMEISHVIRGEEWLPSLALHYLLYEAFNWEAPKFAHLPLILKPVGKGKLSKRDGDQLGFPVFPLNYTDEKTGETSQGYREAGYFPEAFVNMLALLGWNPGDEREVMNMEELIAAFDLENVSKSGAKFDIEKTKWFQHQYMQKQSLDSLTHAFLPILKEKTDQHFDTDYVSKVIDLLQERAVFITDFWELGSYFFKAPDTFDTKAVKKAWKEGATEIVSNLSKFLKDQTDFTSAGLEEKVKAWIQEHELGFGRVLMPLRLSLVGSMQGPHVFDIMEMIGKDESIARLAYAMNHI